MNKIAKAKPNPFNFLQAKGVRIVLSNFSRQVKNKQSREMTENKQFNAVSAVSYQNKYYVNSGLMALSILPLDVTHGILSMKRVEWIFDNSKSTQSF